MSVIENIGYTSLALAIIAAIFVIIVSIIEKKLLKSIIKGRNKRDIFYQTQFKTINRTNPKKTIQDMDSIARNFFAEAFKTTEKDYTELKQFFKKNKNKKAEEFCSLMIEMLYSPEKDNEEIENALNLLNDIISDTHISLKSEQEELEEINKGSRLKKLLRKIHISSVDKEED